MKKSKLMFFKLVKDLPWMFAIAFLIWMIVVIMIFKNYKKKDDSFFKKYKTSFIAIFIALIVTIVDIWFFVQYIPTHFRKHDVVEQTLSTNDIAKELQSTDTTTKTITPVKSKDSATKKIVEIKPAEKIYTTNKASIHFFSSTSAEDIEATNSNTVCALNSKTGDLRFIALIKSFHFENELMQDHFNTEDYMNSDVFPKSEFKGSITNISTVDFTKDATYNITVAGNLTIHGITKKIAITGTLVVAKGKLSVKSIFKIKRIDYGITTDEVADTIEITVTGKFD